jgi:hypothetical protein
MKFIIAILLLATVAHNQVPAKPQPATKQAPRLGFAETKDTTPIVDTDLFDEQKYIEEAGSDSSAVKAKRAAHEAALTREFMDGFNNASECDGIVLLGNGDNNPDFALQIMVDSHDTPGQKPVWAWVLRDVHSDKLMPVGNDDSGKQAASHICQAVRNASNHLK